MKSEKLTSLLETHFEIVQEIITAKEIEGTISNKIQSEKGIGGIYELAEKLAIYFENTHKETVWGIEIDFFETLEGFLFDKIY